MCFFIVYLLKITTSIIKANTIIVSTTKQNKSKYIISNKTASIIAPPPHSQHKLRIKSKKATEVILSPIAFLLFFFESCYILNSSMAWVSTSISFCLLALHFLIHFFRFSYSGLFISSLSSNACFAHSTSSLSCVLLFRYTFRLTNVA